MESLSSQEPTPTENYYDSPQHKANLEKEQQRRKELERPVEEGFLNQMKEKVRGILYDRIQKQSLEAQGNLLSYISGAPIGMKEEDFEEMIKLPQERKKVESEIQSAKNIATKLLEVEQKNLGWENGSKDYKDLMWAIGNIENIIYNKEK